MVIGLTGGVACGKSRAAGLLAEMGCFCLDTDRIAGQLLSDHTGVREALQKRWGDSVLDDRGIPDKKRVAQKAFASESEVRFLENLLHPLVLAHWQRQAREVEGVPVVVEVPLLFEANWESFFTITVTIAAAPEVVQERLMGRPGTPEEWRQRMERQWPLEKKMEAADLVILNNAGETFLREQLEWLLTCLAFSPKS